MILVDTSVWIDHLHRRDEHLASLLERDEVGCHPMVIEELALGSVRDRATVIGLLASLWSFPVVSHDEVMVLVDRQQLWGRGLSAVDAHLMGSAMVVRGGQLWTRDKRLRTACEEQGVAATTPR
ncbi:type II toxin-antitoxin system VapC family toxin [Calidifontibacter sp. DB0510]|uniref:Ribonuclease VapC n=1 Tax=Metallococcus carri TaxID=1656884 RepID=A0A967AY32_9MICO|nr:type II toxin-antitoxin system VapC family toxin [Metallococcus carri]NHN55116.1 type II toxin-antitoxin system VapC family toxin [Metallococcus carri]NOP36193.1 type II toxin-antitoxin system VapC family toxin [Calidifontibacter sp. DB2511S]